MRGRFGGILRIERFDVYGVAERPDNRKFIGHIALFQDLGANCIIEHIGQIHPNFPVAQVLKSKHLHTIFAVWNEEEHGAVTGRLNRQWGQVEHRRRNPTPQKAMRPS